MGAEEKSNLNFDVIKETYIGVLKKYAVINGRARRQEFWIFFLCNFILSLIPGINFIVFLGTIVPNFTVGVRRLHDTNRSGKWLLLCLIPALLTGIICAIGAMTDNINIVIGLSVLAGIVSLGLSILLLVWIAQEGTHGSNKYGSDPKALEYRFTRYHRSLLCEPDTNAFNTVEEPEKKS